MREELRELFEPSKENPISADAMGMFANTVVLVTGAGGSIGSAIVEQLHDCNLDKLIIVESSEHHLYQLMQQISLKGSKHIVPILGSVSDSLEMRRVMERWKPQFVIHAAAFKHVTLMESQPISCLRNNALATNQLAQHCVELGIRKMIMLSTDKAVRPEGIMGASKRIAELAQSVHANPATSLLSVRFGNVLGSRGSVLPLFQDQIRRRIPVTVTDAKVSRFFLSPKEAVRLVFEAAYLGEMAETFVPDSAVSVRIADLAEYCIQAAGQESNGDLQIKFIGLQPGEKMSEEFVYPEERSAATSRKGILRVVASDVSPENRRLIFEQIRSLENAVAADNLAEAISAVKSLVPGYQPSRTISAQLDADQSGQASSQYKRGQRL